MTSHAVTPISYQGFSQTNLINHYLISRTSQFRWQLWQHHLIELSPAALSSDFSPSHMSYHSLTFQVSFSHLVTSHSILPICTSWSSGIGAGFSCLGKYDPCLYGALWAHPGDLWMLFPDLPRTYPTPPNFPSFCTRPLATPFGISEPQFLVHPF